MLSKLGKFASVLGAWDLGSRGSIRMLIAMQKQQAGSAILNNMEVALVRKQLRRCDMLERDRIVCGIRDVRVA